MYKAESKNFCNDHIGFNRTGTLPHRSYYIPFDKNDKIKYTYGIEDRRSSSRFLSLDGEWLIKQHERFEDVEIDEDLTEKIPVPSCVQIHGYDQIQYLNKHFPFPVTFPHLPRKIPTWHYRRFFNIEKKNHEHYYLNFEGVDSSFYLFINGKYKGFSQISHSTSEFDITELINDGENTIDVIVLKWCMSTYLECQDKFRLSGIFRSVYILKRPEIHLTDYRIVASISENDGKLLFINESDVDIELSFEGKTALAKPRKKVEFLVKNANVWSAESPALYTLTLFSCGERITEKVGFRNVSIDGKIFKINGDAIKLKGVNRHDFNCKTGATVTLKNIVEDLKLMKSLNVNAIRTSHYPNMPEFYKLCDSMGFYVMDEADLETHGAKFRETPPTDELWSEYSENMFFAPGITDRHKALVERDKNRPCVIIWSLGNEASFGKAFFEGAKYIRQRDKTRPVHYEGLQKADKKYYYTKLVDMISMMYPSVETIQKQVLSNPRETRPFVLCEYVHSLGNSSGDISKYWDLIYNNEQCMGGFVWEWADHAIKTKKGLIYGGDSGESEHDSHYCCDGVVTADRKLKSAALEMRAVYGGKIKAEYKDVPLPQISSSGKNIEMEVCEDTGKLISLKADGKEILNSPMSININRQIDGEIKLAPYLEPHRLLKAQQIAYSTQKTDEGYTVHGVMAPNCLMPLLEYNISYALKNGALEIELEYTLADRVPYFPRVGLEFTVAKEYDKFAFIGFGPDESYSDKKVHCEYGYHESCASDNYFNYIHPQESGSHDSSKYLRINGLFEMTADKPFSFSVNPYTTKQLCTTAHSYELCENNFVNVCIDVAMRGIGSHSCGPMLDKEYEISRKGKNKFTFYFND